MRIGNSLYSVTDHPAGDGAGETGRGRGKRPLRTRSTHAQLSFLRSLKMIGFVARRAAVSVPRVLARRGYAEVASNSDKLRLSLVLPHDVSGCCRDRDMGQATHKPYGPCRPRSSVAEQSRRCRSSRQRAKLTNGLALCLPLYPLAKPLAPVWNRSSTRRRMSSRSTSPPSRVTSVCKSNSLSAPPSPVRAADRQRAIPLCAPRLCASARMRQQLGTGPGLALTAAMTGYSPRVQSGTDSAPFRSLPIASPTTSRPLRLSSRVCSRFSRVPASRRSGLVSLLSQTRAVARHGMLADLARHPETVSGGFANVHPCAKDALLTPK